MATRSPSFRAQTKRTLFFGGCHVQQRSQELATGSRIWQSPEFRGSAKMHLARYLCVVLGLVILAGCVPAAVTVVPQIRGRVIDTTGAPITGATVSIAPADSPDLKARTIKTDGRGCFQRGQEKRWFLAVPVAAHAVGPEFIATASHRGMQSAPKRFGGD